MYTLEDIKKKGFKYIINNLIQEAEFDCDSVSLKHEDNVIVIDVSIDLTDSTRPITVYCIDFNTQHIHGEDNYFPLNILPHEEEELKYALLNFKDND